MNPPNCPECGKRVVDLNNAIAKWAPTIVTPESSITVVDCWTGFNTDTMTGDGVHPNAKGNDALAECWYGPLAKAIKDSA